MTVRQRRSQAENPRPDRPSATRVRWAPCGWPWVLALTVAVACVPDTNPLALDRDGDGFSTFQGDCDDANPDVFPGGSPRDLDADGVCDDWDACDGDDASGDPDGDGFCSDIDNCPSLFNMSQRDDDLDGLGDACDACFGDDASGDLDGDGICSAQDDDDDGDGCMDFVDRRPNESHADGDADGCPDDCDAHPNAASGDADGDLVSEDCDLCLGSDLSGDVDADGLCNDRDTDIDGDGCFDASEDHPEGLQVRADVDPWTPSTDLDGDGLASDCDLCLGDDLVGDLDADGSCDDLDPDVDGDGLDNASDPCLGEQNQADVDADGLCDDVDHDDDGDGLEDPLDPCIGAANDLDTDQDGRCDDFDEDDDGDGLLDLADPCLGALNTQDPDGDGRCNDLDDDDDDDGLADGDDQCPTGLTGWSSTPDVDLDGDGCHDADEDDDDDGDGCTDGIDAAPNTPAPDLDGDLVSEDCDLCEGNDELGDTDGDGLCLDHDICPDDFDPQQTDGDGDGVGDACDMCAGDDGAGDADSDAVCDDLDQCEGSDAAGDVDQDGVCADLDCDDDDPLRSTDPVDCAPVSCLEHLEAAPSGPSGTYWINPTGAAPLEITCDMTSDGGGWSLIGMIHTADGDNVPEPQDWFVNGNNEAPLADGTLIANAQPSAIGSTMLTALIVEGESMVRFEAHERSGSRVELGYRRVQSASEFASWWTSSATGVADTCLDLELTDSCYSHSFQGGVGGGTNFGPAGSGWLTRLDSDGSSYASGVYNSRWSGYWNSWGHGLKIWLREREPAATEP